MNASAQAGAEAAKKEGSSLEQAVERLSQSAEAYAKALENSTAGLQEWNEKLPVFNFDGYYLEETDPQEYDKYYLFVCPEGDYATYADADAADLTYCGIGGMDYAKCPYRFAFEQYMLENGRYTMVLAKMGGDVEVQFTAEKKGPTDWKMDFSNVKCPKLESKYAK